MLIVLYELSCKNDYSVDWRGEAKFRFKRFLYCCGLNNIVLLGLTIWGAAVFSASDEEVCQSLDESAGCEMFLQALERNVIVGMIYSIGLMLLPGPCIIVYVAWNDIDINAAYWNED